LDILGNRPLRACGTCMDARSTLDESTDWTLWADKVITY
jgi:sulfur relay (sulfurtransferase) complex TusBCD TusD component (DsrE family)